MSLHSQEFFLPGWYWFEGKLKIGGKEFQQFPVRVPAQVEMIAFCQDEQNPFTCRWDGVIYKMKIWGNHEFWMADGQFTRMEIPSNVALEYALFPGYCKKCKAPASINRKVWGEINVAGRCEIQMICDCSQGVSHPWDEKFGNWAKRILLLGSPPTRQEICLKMVEEIESRMGNGEI